MRRSMLLHGGRLNSVVNQAVTSLLFADSPQSSFDAGSVASNANSHSQPRLQEQGKLCLCACSQLQRMRALGARMCSISYPTGVCLAHRRHSLSLSPPFSYTYICMRYVQRTM